MKRLNRILLTDSYKTTHAVQYPPGTSEVYSYFESRGGEFPLITFFGLQYLIKEYILPPVTREEVEYGFERLGKHIGPAALQNKTAWLKLVEKHGGKFPIEIKAVPEGTTVGTKNVLVTVRNTDPEFYWLTNYIETLLVQLWYPTTVATLSREMKRVLHQSLVDTGDPSLLPFKLHDFGFRGVSSVESAGLGGAAHLVNFMGTDTMAALELTKDYYDCDMAGFSIPAAEHSTITSWGRENEAQAYANMLNQFPNGLVAVVSDSYDIFRACSDLWGGSLKDAVISHGARGGCLVVRPDSGEPDVTLLKVLNILGERFGTTRNDKGFKVLPPFLRVIYGDGIDLSMLKRIAYTLKSNAWSMDNCAFGCGGALLQKMNRDTARFAFKCSSVTVNGEERDVFKSPIGDSGKASKKGKLKLVLDMSWQDKTVGPQYITTSTHDSRPDSLRTVFKDGELLIDESLDTIRARAVL